MGSLLCSLLLLPGLAMICGGLKYKEQRFNPLSAGVSSVLLITSIVAAFTPTLFYQIYGGTNLECGGCFTNITTGAIKCTQCFHTPLDLDVDPMYVDRARVMQWIIAAIMPLTYIIGLIFTLKTHSHIYDIPIHSKELAKGSHDEEEGGGHGGGHGGPAWNIPVSLMVLLIATGLFAVIAELITGVVQPVSESLGLSQTFVGLTLIALIPSISELVNAILFAMQDNISLSMEIGSALAAQIALIQIPVLVAFSAIYNHGAGEGSFTMIFPVLEVFGVVMAVIITNYLSTDGRSNYFLGSALVAVYVLLIAAFYFQPDQEQNMSLPPIMNKTEL